MHAPKAAKRERPEKNHFTIHHCSLSSQTARPLLHTDDYYQVVSIDPATDNFALRIERRWFNGTIVTLEWNKIKFDRVTDESGLSILYLQITSYLNNYIKHYVDTHHIIIERQMAINNLASRVCQHVISYFVIMCQNHTKHPVIYEVDPKVKGKLLGVPKGLNRTELKRWGVEKCRELLYTRGDKVGSSILDGSGKKLDDSADTLIQIEALYTLLGLPLTITHPAPSSEIFLL